MRSISDPEDDPIGSIGFKELQDILQALMLVRPDFAEALTAVCIATDTRIKIPERILIKIEVLNEGELR